MKGRVTSGPTCRTVEVNGVPVLVQFAGDHEITEADRAALAQLVEACRRDYEAEHPTTTESDS